MAHANDELIERFYGAFARHDGDAMAACYAPDARFSDPVFTELHGEEPGAMWRMLTGRAEDLEVGSPSTRRTTRAAARTGSRTTPSGPAARSHNDVRAEFRFENGLIAEHRDSFSFYAWSRQALGPDRPRARLDADRALEGPERGPRGARRVPRPLGQAPLGAPPGWHAASRAGSARCRAAPTSSRAEAAAGARVGAEHACLRCEHAAAASRWARQEVEARLGVARLVRRRRSRWRPRGGARRSAARSAPRRRRPAPRPSRPER